MLDEVSRVVPFRRSGANERRLEKVVFIRDLEDLPIDEGAEVNLPLEPAV